MAKRNRQPRATLAAGVLLLIPMLSLGAAGNRNEFDDIIRTASLRSGIPESLIHSLIRAESNYNPNAVSRKGAVGLMQLMPETARDYGVEDPYDPEKNIEAGVQHLRTLMKMYDGNTRLVLAAYNAGQQAVDKYGGVPPFKETIDYVNRITSDFGRSVIKPRGKIYTFSDGRGGIVLTNMPYFNGNRLRLD